MLRTKPQPLLLLAPLLALMACGDNTSDKITVTPCQNTEDCPNGKICNLNNPGRGYCVPNNTPDEPDQTPDPNSPDAPTPPPNPCQGVMCVPPENTCTGNILTLYSPGECNEETGQCPPPNTRTIDCREENLVCEIHEGEASCEPPGECEVSCAPGSWCDPTDNQCYRCLQDEHCGPGNTCDLEKRQCQTSPETCVDDALEENDALQRATPHETLTAQSLHNLSICPEDEDWFELRLEAGQVIQARALYYVPFGNLELSIYNQNGFFRRGSRQEENSLILADQVPEAGTYYLVVHSPNHDTNVYHLDLQIQDESHFCLDDVHEPNNAISEGSPLEEGRHDLNFCRPPGSADEDWFLVQAGSNQQLRFVLEHRGLGLGLSINTRLDGLIVEADEDNNQKSLLLQTTDPQEFLIRVYDPNLRDEGLWGTYTLEMIRENF